MSVSFQWVTAEPRGSLFKFLLVGESGSAVKTYLPLSNAHSDVFTSNLFYNHPSLSTIFFLESIFFAESESPVTKKTMIPQNE